MADEIQQVPQSDLSQTQIQAPDTSQQPVEGGSPNQGPTFNSDGTQVNPSGMEPTQTPNTNTNTVDTPDQQQQQQQSQPSQQQNQSKPPVAAPTPNPADHPVVKSAGIIHSIAQTLAGGPRTSYSIDPNTGKMTTTQQPLSGRQIAQAIALAALSGGVAGLGERGPGVEGKAAAAGYQSVTAQQQQQSQQQQQQASQDFARQAQVTSTNFQTHQNALRLGQMEYDQHKQWVSDNAPVLKNIQDAGAALESGVHEQDLTNKYHVTKDMAIPDGVVPRMGANGEQATNPDGSKAWDNTYTVIDPQKKIALPEDTAQFLADHHVPGYFTIDKTTGKATPVNFSGSAPIKAGLVVNGIQLASGIRITESSINKQLSSLKDGEGESQAFEVNLKDALSKGDVTGKALQAFAPYSGMPLDQAFDAMRKNKVDPQLVGQVESLIPQDAKLGIKEARESSEAARKAQDAKANLVVNQNNFEDVLGSPKNYSPEQVQAANQIYARIHKDKINDAAGEASARAQAEINVKKANGIPLTSSGKGVNGDDLGSLTHPELASYLQDPNNYNTPDGTNQAFLQAMMKTDPERARLIQAYSQGMDIQSYYAAVKKFGGSLAADIHAYDPTFNASNMRAYDKTIQDNSAAGKMGKTNAAASTAIEHLGALHDAYGISAATGVSGDYDTALNQAATETASMYANGNKPGEDEIRHTREALDHPLLASKGREAAVKTAREAMDKIEENFNQYDKDLPAGIHRVGPLSPKAAAAYQKMTGETVDPRLINPNAGHKGRPQPSAQPNVAQPNARLNVVPKGAFPARSAQGAIVGYKDAQGNITRF